MSSPPCESSLKSVSTDKYYRIVLRDIKNDTEHILQDTSTLKQDTTQIKRDIDRILVEISRLQSQLRTTESSRGTADYVLERYLSVLKTDTETVLGDADYLDNRSDYSSYPDDERRDDQSAAGEFSANIARSGKGIAGARVATYALPARNQGEQPDAPIIFTNAYGRRHPIPYAACRTWTVSFFEKSIFSDHHLRALGYGKVNTAILCQCT